MNTTRVNKYNINTKYTFIYVTQTSERGGLRPKAAGTRPTIVEAAGGLFHYGVWKRQMQKT